MDAHTITVEFDDDDLSLEQIIEALGNAGYTVPDHTKVP
jgi:copper chaperone CopZ